MKFLIVSNDYEVYSAVTEVIESYNFGEVIKSNYSLENCLLEYKEIDVLIIDLLTAINNCLQTLLNLINSFKGKVIIISQIKDKGTIAQAYFLGAEYYIVKPINQLEIVEILKKVIRLVHLENCVYNVRNILRLSN